MKLYIHSNSDIGQYRGKTYGIEDSGQQRYYFQYEPGKFCYGDTEEEIEAKIDQWLDNHIVEGSEKQTKTKKYTLTYEISQVWYENGEEVDRDTWTEKRTTHRADNELIAQAIVETKLEREYGCHTNVGPWELELNCIDIKEG